MYNQNTYIKNNTYTLNKTDVFLREIGSKIANYHVKNVRIEGFNLYITINKEFLRYRSEFNKLHSLAKTFRDYFLKTKEGYHQGIRTSAGFKRESKYGIRFKFVHNLNAEFTYSQIYSFLQKHKENTK